MGNPPIPVSTPEIRLWFLPVLGALLPALAAIVALRISVAQEFVAACNPFIDGCVSISRAARYGLANHVFRALVLPAAVLQSLTWVLCAAWLARCGANGNSLRWIAGLGVLAGVCLVLYGSFLGTEGEAYRWMRRYGVIVYFGFTYLCMAITAAHLRGIASAGRQSMPVKLDAALVVLLAATLLAGLASAFISRLTDDEAFANRMENIFEWYAGAAFTLYFAGLGWLWRSTRLRVALHAGAP